MMAPAISIAIFNAICKREGCVVELFETTQYSDEHANRHVVMGKIGGSRADLEDLVTEIFSIKPLKNIIPDFIEVVTRFKPDLILMSVQEDVWPTAQRLIESISHLNIPHILGGVFINSAWNIALRHPLVKMVVPGEGEQVVVDVINAIKNNAPLNLVKGIYWKDKFGLTHKNPPQPLCDINQITPDFSCFPAQRWQRPMGGRLFKRAVSMETYRGCPYNCTFCNSPNTRNFSKTEGIGNYMRRKSATCIEREYLYYKEIYDPDLIMFIDDSFLARPKSEIFEFCEMWSRYKVPFWFNTRIENCEPEYLEALKKAGVYRMTFGIESGNEDYRAKFLDRKVSTETYLKYFQHINESNIPYSLNVIIGMPFETCEMVLETARLVHAARGYDGLTISKFQPYHGTKLRNIAVEHGFVPEEYINSDESLLGFIGSYVLRMPEPYLQPDEVEMLVKYFSLYAFFNESRWHEIEQSKTDADLYDKLLEEYRTNFFGSIQRGGKDKISELNRYYCNKHDSSATYIFRNLS